MKKRLITLLIAFVMMFTLIVPAYAADTTAAPETDVSKYGGVDFYSITVNYSKPILVDYTKEYLDKKQQDYRLLFETEDGNKVMDDKVILRAGVTEALDYIGFDKSVFKLDADSQNAISNFYQLSEPSQGIVTGAHYSNFPYDYAYITHIQDGTLLKSKTAFSFYGIFDPYDEAEPYKNQNPNVQYDKDGYALDKTVDENGQNYRIDVNGYRIDANGLWYDDTGSRVELFYEPPVLQYTGSENNTRGVNLSYAVTDELVPFDYANRFGDDGKIKPLEDMYAYFYISNTDLVKFFKENKATATPGKPAIVPLKKAAATKAEAETTGAELIETVVDKGTNRIENVTRAGEKFKTPYFYVVCSVDTYRVSTTAKTVNEKGEVSIDKSKEMTDEVYSAPTTSFDSVFIARDTIGNRIYSTPVYGEPKLNVEIESITVEIDAAGTVDGGNDPQNLNEITVSLNDFSQNIKLKEEALADKWISQATFDSYKCQVLGTVKSKTTTDKVEWNMDTVKDHSYKSTVQSLKLDLTKEQLASIPTTASVFVSFNIKTHQPAEAFDSTHIKYAKDSTDSSLYTQNAYMWTRPAEQEKVEQEGINWLLVIIIAASAVVVIAIVVVVLLLVLKKKKK